MDRKENERIAQEKEAEATRESRHLKDQVHFLILSRFLATTDVCILYTGIARNPSSTHSYLQTSSLEYKMAKKLLASLSLARTLAE